MKKRAFKFTEIRNESIFQIKYQLTQHATKRCQQRGLDLHMLKMVLRYGRTISRQGYTFYYCILKDIPKPLIKRMGKKLKDLVIVTKDDTCTIITCYWSNKGMRGIRKKTNYLIKYAA